MPETIHPILAIYCSSDSWGGLEMNTFRLALWMIRRENRLILMCLDGSPLMDHATEAGIPVIPVTKNRRYADLVNAKRIVRLLRRNSIGVLMVVDNYDLDLGAWVKTFSGRRLKLIYQQHMMLGRSKRDPLHTWRFGKLDAWITLLPYMAEQIGRMTRFHRSNIHVIPLGVDHRTIQPEKYSREEARQKLGIDARYPLLGILGRIDRQKGQHIVIDAMKLLHDRGIDTSLLIMGDPTQHEGDQYLEELKEQIHAGGLTGRITITGHSEDTAVFFCAIDLFVLGSYAETYGMVTIESMMYGVPVAGSDAGGTVELLEKGNLGWLYAPGDPADLSRKIEYILTNRHQVGEKIKTARAHALAVYSHDRECRMIEALISSL
jgi:glycosyltransferase involved in cell wall biosynthesis